MPRVRFLKGNTLWNVTQVNKTYQMREEGHKEGGLKDKVVYPKAPHRISYSDSTNFRQELVEPTASEGHLTVCLSSDDA